MGKGAGGKRQGHGATVRRLRGRDHRPRRGDGKRSPGPSRRIGTEGTRRSSKEDGVNAQELVKQAESRLQEGQLEAALPIAQKALAKAQDEAGAHVGSDTLPVLNLLAEIHLELGDPDQARQYFLAAVDADPDGTASFDKETGSVGVEKFLYLAQLSEEGGEDSIHWLEQGATILRREINIRRDTLSKFERMRLDGNEPEDPTLQALQGSLARALCAEIEIYMTDLSFSSESEGYCEKLIAEALPLAAAAANSDPTALQTLANIRISQCRLPEAQQALNDSLALWDNTLPDDGETNKVPDFPTRISLARLLMEAEIEVQALDILERLILEDDHSVEAWYLGGWCFYLIAQKGAAGGETPIDLRAARKASREWLKQSLALYELLEYEDDRLRDHATELVGELDGMLPEGEGDDDDDGDDDVSDGGEWESEDDDDRGSEETEEPKMEVG